MCISLARIAIKSLMSALGFKRIRDLMALDAVAEAHMTVLNKRPVEKIDFWMLYSECILYVPKNILEKFEKKFGRGKFVST